MSETEATADTMAKSETEGEAELLAHSYDGIQEFDNPLPGWWAFILFWLSILFTPVYLWVYHVSAGGLVADEYAAAAAELGELRAEQALKETVSNESLAALKGDAGAMSKAKEIFMGKCAMCHGPEGQGTIGPNLTDAYWLHGSELVDVYTTIDKGVPEKGMVPWGLQLQPAELRYLAAYVATLEGTNPPNPKPPEGEPKK